MAKWKIIKGEPGDKCGSCGKDISKKKAYIKKASSFGGMVVKSLLWRGSAYCSQSCFSSANS